MKRYINQAVIKKESFSSNNISVLSYIVHPIIKEGIYRGKIYKGKSPISQFELIVGAEGEKQLNIDTNAFGKKGTQKAKKMLLQKGGYLLLFDSQKDENYQLRLDHIDKKVKTVFDNTELQKGDLYAVTMLRPGRYHAHLGERYGNAMKIEVQYPDTENTDKPAEEQRTTQITVTEKGLPKKTIKIFPGQGLVFSMETAGTVQIQLEEAFEKPKTAKPPKRVYTKKGAPRKVRWENPKYKK